MVQYFQSVFFSALSAFLNASLFLSILTFASVTVQARAFPQQQEDESEIGRRIKQNQTKKAKGSTNTANKKQAHTKKRGLTATTVRLQPVTQVVATFFAQTPETQILLNGEVIGLTDHESKLVAKVKSGEYMVTTKFKDVETMKPHLITISTRANKFDLAQFYVKAEPQTVTVTPPPPQVSATPIPTNPPTTNEQKAQAPRMPSPNEVLQRYKNPKTHHKVTVSDWQAVFYQCTTGAVAGASEMQLKSQALFALGQLKFIEGNYADALDAFNSSASLLPNSPLAFYGLGNAYLATNQPEQAIRAYEQTIKLDDKFVLAYKGLGDVFAKQSKPKEALEKYEKARDMGYQGTEISYYLGVNRLRQRKWTEALQELEIVAQEKPSVEIYIAIGDCHRELKRSMSAANSYRKAIELDPKSAEAHAKLGELLLKEREYEESKNHLERALVLDQTGKEINRMQVRKLADEAAKKMR